ncbi:MAG: S41 family peptidase [Verrucomicrobiota bacterium]
MRIATLLLLLNLLLPAQQNTELPDRAEGYQHVERFIDILEHVRQNHPDAQKLTYERLINHALEGMLGSLDPFSAFYHPETAQHLDPAESNAEPQFQLPGLGITLAQKDNQIYLAAIRDYSPAANADLRLNDVLLKRDDTNLANLDLPFALQALSGQPGETVTLTIYRKNGNKELTTSLLRSVVKEKPVVDVHFLPELGDAKIAYLRLTQFTAEAPRQLELALDDLEDQGLQGLILDLRGNPGGLLDAAVKILALFLPPDTEVVTTQGRSPAAQTEPLKTPARQRVQRDYPLVVLIDRASASASELVAGALQDLERATIVGETSYGKGSVQNIDPRPGGTALRLTFATYHTPSGKTPHLVGVTPDINFEITEADRKNFELHKSRDFLPPETRDQLTNWQDPFLKAASAALK